MNKTPNNKGISPELSNEILNCLLNDETFVNIGQIKYIEEYNKKNLIYLENKIDGFTEHTRKAVELLIEYKEYANISTNLLSRLLMNLIHVFEKSQDKNLQFAAKNIRLLWKLKEQRDALKIREYIIEEKENLLKEKEEELKEKTIESTTDPLTGLNNKRSSNNKLKNCIDTFKMYGTKFSILLIDLDDFKQVNDIYGHNVGDKVLKHIASTLKGCIRKGDFIARWGGEEFLIILESSSEEDAFNKAENIRKIVSVSPYEELNANTCSIGVITSNINIPSENLFELADKAMYEAKIGGKNKVCVA